MPSMPIDWPTALALPSVDIDSSRTRRAPGIRCACGGFASRVDPTTDEDKEHGCGRSGCCTRAYVCGLCQTRYAGAAEAPEME